MTSDDLKVGAVLGSIIVSLFGRGSGLVCGILVMGAEIAAQRKATGLVVRSLDSKLSRSVDQVL
jgi:hypothetical protein